MGTSEDKKNAVDTRIQFCYWSNIHKGYTDGSEEHFVHWKSKHQNAAISNCCCKSETEQLKNTSPSCCEIIQIKTKTVSILVEQSKLLWTDNGLPLLWTETVKHWNTTQDLKNEVAIQPLCELTILLLKHYTCISRMNWSKASTMHKCCP